MASDATPPHITALIDQGQAQQRHQDQPPPGVVLQVRLRRIELADGTVGLASSFVTNVDGPQEAAAAMITLEATIAEYQHDVAAMIGELAKLGPAGIAEAVHILNMVTECRATTAHRVNTDD